jgi:hypothetical protein
VAPCWSDAVPYYALFVERGDPLDGPAGRTFVRELDEALGEHNAEYASKRDSERLGPPRLAVLAPGFWQQWDRDRLTRAGGVPEQYKHPCLLGDVKFRETAPVVEEIVYDSRET